MTYQSISIEEAEAMLASEDATVLDIRDPQSFAAGSIEQAINVSNDNVDAIVASTDKNKPLIIYCYHGNTSKAAADYFYQVGFKRSYSVNGGYELWKLKL